MTAVLLILALALAIFLGGQLDLSYYENEAHEYFRTRRLVPRHTKWFERKLLADRPRVTGGDSVDQKLAGRVPGSIMSWEHPPKSALFLSRHTKMSVNRYGGYL